MATLFEYGNFYFNVVVIVMALLLAGKALSFFQLCLASITHGPSSAGLAGLSSVENEEKINFSDNILSHIFSITNMFKGLENKDLVSLRF